MKQVIVFPRGQLSIEDKSSLTDAGILVVEADDPKAVIQLIPTNDFINASTLVMSLLRAVVGGSNGDRFSAELERRLLVEEREKEL